MAMETLKERLQKKRKITRDRISDWGNNERPYKKESGNNKRPDVTDNINSI